MLEKEKSRLEAMWQSHEKSCRPQSLSIPSNHFSQLVQQQQQQQQTQQAVSPNHMKLLKRDDLNEMIKQFQQTDKKQQTGLIAPQQSQPPSIMRSSPQGTLNITAVGTPSASLEDQKQLNLFLQAAGSALLTPKSAFANKTIDNFLNTMDHQNSSGSGGGNSNGVMGGGNGNAGGKLQSPSQLLDLGSGGSSTLQRPNNLSLRGSGQASTPNAYTNSPLLTSTLQVGFYS